ncbi:MAG: GntR family transcriptional regulator [Deltaproteobacteria bacterium]|nr:GntR family transcriptional regulator [Deltaproteobacteria bacterium]
MKIVDASNPIPKYLQISAWLNELIETGRYRTGEQLPSEVELAKMCDVTRTTVRQAIAELTARGLLRKEKGTGTFVSAPAPAELRQKLEYISSTTDLMQDSGIAQSTRVLEKRVVQAEDQIAKLLFLGANKKVILLRRVRMGDGTPYVYEESYLPYDLFKGILDKNLTGSMYKLISEQFNVVLARCAQTISAVNLIADVAKILKLPANAAGIFMESLTFDENSIPVELLYSYLRGDTYKLEIELGRYHAGAKDLNIKTD